MACICVCGGGGIGGGESVRVLWWVRIWGCVVGEGGEVGFHSLAQRAAQRTKVH